MASTIKVNTITTESGSTITLGESGKTIALACGASQTGFGRTGTVDWCTTAKTSPLTAVSGKGYFVNTCGGVVTVTLPSSPSAGDIVSIKDYAGTFGSNALTLGRGGSKISGFCLDATVNTNGQSITMVYVDGTKGWLNIQTEDTVQGKTYVAASGGNATLTVGDYKTHIFTADGTLTVTNGGNSAGSNTVDYLVVAGGGGGGGKFYTGGGGAGGFRVANGISEPNMSPLANPTGAPVSASPGSYPIAVGGGGAGGPAPTLTTGTVGVNSSFSSITSAGGGGGGTETTAATSGGSGGGENGYGPGPPGGCGAGSGNTPPVSPPQGNDGGIGLGSPASYAGGGGGGAGEVGSTDSPSLGGDGSYVADGYFGPTAPSYGTAGTVGSVRYFAGGGGGGQNAPTPSTFAGGEGGGGNGRGNAGNGGPGCTNTGGGGGGTGNNSPSAAAGGNGGSGFVAIRYKFQN